MYSGTGLQLLGLVEWSGLCKLVAHVLWPYPVLWGEWLTLGSRTKRMANRMTVDTLVPTENMYNILIYLISLVVEMYNLMTAIWSECLCGVHFCLFRFCHIIWDIEMHVLVKYCKKMTYWHLPSSGILRSVNRWLVADTNAPSSGVKQPKKRKGPTVYPLETSVINY